MRILTTCVGSFPLEFSKENIERIISDLHSIGIDYAPYPQLRSFVDMFLESLVKNGKLLIIKGKYIIKNVEELKLDFNILEIKEAEFSVSYLRERGISFKGLRAPITGPLTLAFQILTEPEGDPLKDSIIKDKELIFKFFIDYICSYINYFTNLGYDFIVLDEPVLSIIVGAKRIMFSYTIDDLIEVYSKIFKNSRAKLNGIHVCGRLPKLLKEILLHVDNLKVLDHEHKSVPENLEYYTKDEIEKYDKFLSIGVVSSKDPEIESPIEIENIVKRAYEKYGERLMFIKPDCGFAPLRSLKDYSLEKAYNIALEKLKNIKKVVDKLCR